MCLALVTGGSYIGIIEEVFCSWVYPHFTLLSQGYGFISFGEKKGDGEMSEGPGVSVRRGEEFFKEGRDQIMEDWDILFLGGSSG